jgi:hypothetical protein
MTIRAFIEHEVTAGKKPATVRRYIATIGRAHIGAGLLNPCSGEAEQIEAENQLRAHSLELREKEWEVAARERERALADAREHLLLLSKSLGRDQATLKARDQRILDLEAQIAQYRQQIASPRRAVMKSVDVRTRPGSKAGRAKRLGGKRKAVSKPKPASRRRAQPQRGSRKKR